MARPAVISVEGKFRLSVVSGEMTVAEAARRSKVSEQSIGNWKRQFLEGGKQGLADGGRPGSSPQVQRLEDEVEDLKTALGEAHVELRAWKKSACHHRPHSGLNYRTPHEVARTWEDLPEHQKQAA
jgi:transposase